MPNLVELLNQISAELSKNDTEPILISVVDLDYAYGQMKLAPNIAILQSHGRKLTDTTDSVQGFTARQTYLQYFKRKQTVHSDTKHPYG